MEQKTRFKDLSMWLKVAAIVSWVQLAFLAAMFLISVSELMGA